VSTHHGGMKELLSVHSWGCMRKRELEPKRGKTEAEWTKANKKGARLGHEAGLRPLKGEGAKRPDTWGKKV